MTMKLLNITDKGVGRRSYEVGFSLVELLVASLISSLVIGGLLSTVVDTRKFIERDRSRISSNQSLRAMMDLIGQDIRLVGQRLRGVFPAVELIDGGATSPDTLVLRRRLINETLTLCENVTGGAGWLVVGTPDGDTDSGPEEDIEPSCVMGATGANERFEAFRDRRLKSGGSAVIYLYNPTSREGVFLSHVDDELTTGSQMRIRATGGGVDYTRYPPRSVVMVLEEARYSVNPTTGEVELSINQPLGRVLPIGKNIVDFNVSITDEAGSIQESWSADLGWGYTREFRITLSERPDSATEFRAQSRTLDGLFFPRNLLSF